MSYHIAVAPAALAALRGLLNRRMREVLERRIEALVEEPEEQGLPLVGPLRGCFSLRAEGGWCRIIYRVAGDQVQILTVAMGGRAGGRTRDWHELARRLFRLRLL